jgi:hypothetical protein
LGFGDRDRLGRLFAAWQRWRPAPKRAGEDARDPKTRSPTRFFVTFMQHGFEKAHFGRISGICWFVARLLAGMVTWREREIPGRKLNSRRFSLGGYQGEAGQVRIDGR